MSVRRGAPYNDRVEDNGRVLIYEGHNINREIGGPDPKATDQPMTTSNDKLTQNGLFYHAAQKYKSNKSSTELIKVYEKIRTGIWVYNGIFKLVDAWIESDGVRNVFKYKLEITLGANNTYPQIINEIDYSRIIPANVKFEVWKRDNGKCVVCGSTTNLHFDHIIPFSKGGSSLVAKNIQLLCAKHNLEKRDKIQ